MRKILLLFFFIFLSFSSQATHIMGGEITWVCIKDPGSINFGKYIFTLKVYRDCTGSAQSISTYPLEVWDHPTISSIALTHIATNDISPDGDPTDPDCLDCTSPQLGAVEEWVFISSPIALPGIPSIGGWHFTWDSCCRNGAITNLALSSTTSPVEGFTLRAAMFPYTDNSGNLVPADPCHDNSPIFKEDAKTILCTGYPFSYSNLGFDVELDSVSYSWDEPLDDFFGTFNPPVNPAPISWDAPYSTTSPLPGGVSLDPITGQISYNSNTSGNFVSVIRADAFRCGQKIASIYREIQVVLMTCVNLSSGNPNSPPEMISPFTNSITGLPSNDTIVMAGRSISFSICAEDMDTNTSGILQNLTLEMQGGQLDSFLAIGDPDNFFSNSSDIAFFTVTDSDPGKICGEFIWTPNCFHLQDLGCGVGGSGFYTFNIKAFDDFCPANGIVISTITINVIPPVPDLRCLAVDLSGGVDVSLTYPIGVSDPNIKYDLYFSKQIDGPYSLLDSIFYPDTTFYHSGSDANQSKSYYYLVGTSTCGTNIASLDNMELYSDTLSTILMNSTAINMGLTAELNWNPIRVPLLYSSALDYELHYINANYNDVIIQVLPDTFAQMDGDICDYYPQFYVEIPDASGCVSKSSISKVNLFDTLSPATPYIKDISVDINGKSVVSWSVSPNSDFYIVYMQDNNGAWITLDTVLFGVNSYVFANSSATTISENFTVRALDSCGNTMFRSEVHNSIFVSYFIDVCAKSIYLNWNEYINWSGGVNHYNVFINEIDENGVVISEVITVTNATEYLIDSLTLSSQYEIYVEAYNFDASFVAVSNLLDFNIPLAAKPKFHYIEYVTVNPDNGFIELNCFVDNEVVIDHYDIYRSKIVNGVEVSLDLIDNVSFNGTSSVHYIDNEASSSNYSYLYKTYPVDTCGITLNVPPVNDPAYANDISFAQSIFLEVEVNKDYSNFSVLEIDFTNTITFNEYDKWLGNVLKYELFRSINNEPFVMLPIKTWDMDNNSNQELVFIDKVAEFGETNGKFCYYIKATEGNNTPYGSVTEGSLSNIVCISQTPNIFVPNTFTPNGDEHNEVFRPIAYFVSEVGYSFSIFNRNGSEIFSTNEPLKGWNGTYKGSNVQNDNYVYHLQYINSDGDLTHKTDAFTLVR